MKVTPREKLIIIIGICAVVVMGIAYAALTFVPDREDLSQTVELNKKKLRSLRDTLSREESYKRRLDQFKKQLEQDMTKFLPGDNSSIASAELQKVVKELADQAGVEITQRNPLQDKKVQDIATKVSIRIETSCSPDQLVQFLASIENYEKMLNVDEMMIASIRLPKKYEIRPSLTISGFIRSQPEKPKEKAVSRAGLTGA